MKVKLYIIGAGGHGKAVADAALLQGKYEIAGFADDTRKKGEQVIGSFTVIATIEELKTRIDPADHFVVAIGNNAIRKKLFTAFSAQATPGIIIHPSAIVSSFSSVGEGSLILAGAVLNADSVIGKNCIINSLSLVDHDVRVGDHVHVSQGAIIGSNSSVGDEYPIAPGAIISVQSKLK